jgi:hypothetical protein
VKQKIAKKSEGTIKIMVRKMLELLIGEARQELGRFHLAKE